LLTAGGSGRQLNLVLARAAKGLYEAELALHDAHQSGTDRWIAAAGGHLHAAVERYLAADRAAGVSCVQPAV
jgi:hypothetical protein